MGIDAATLIAQYHVFEAAHPGLMAGAERSHGLPPFTLAAVGSRETNLDLYYTCPPGSSAGDGGHANGPWQYDNRTPGRAADIAKIDAGDMALAAQIAASMLASNMGQGEVAAYNIYNSGQPQTRYTAGGDYGPDVAGRRQTLVATFPYPPEGGLLVSTSCSDPATGGAWTVTPDGAVYTDTAGKAPYLGGLNEHPDWHAGQQNRPGDPATGIEARKDPSGAWGYRIFTFDGKTTGFYDFDRKGDQR